MNYKIPNKYYVVAIERNDRHPEGETVFYAIDTHSGGYPYWTNYVGQAEDYDSIKDASVAFDGSLSGYMKNKNISGVAIVRAVTNLTVVRDEDIKREKVKIALDKLTDEEKELLGLGGAK